MTRRDVSRRVIAEDRARITRFARQDALSEAPRRRKGFGLRGASDPREARRAS